MKTRLSLTLDNEIFNRLESQRREAKKDRSSFVEEIILNFLSKDNQINQENREENKNEQ